LITDSDEVLIWNIGGPLTSIDTSKARKLMTSNWTISAVVFHPYEKDHFFVLYIWAPHFAGFMANLGETVHVVVQEFIKSQHHNTYHKEFFAFGCTFRRFDPNTLRVVEADALCIFRWVNKDQQDHTDFVFSFDMFTHKLDTGPRTLPGVPSNLMAGIRSLSCVDGPVVLDSSVDLETALNNAAVYGLVDDGNFVVLFGQYGYIVWCFDKDVKLPLSGSLFDNCLEVPPADRPHPLKPIS
jgi:hypothetical protein